MPRIRAHLSRRSAYLLGFGAVWVTYGDAIRHLPQDASLAIYGTVPTSWQGWAWIVCGALCIVSVVIPHFPRWVGFPAAAIMPVLWCLGFVVDLSRGDFALHGAVIWGLFAALAIMSAGDEEGPR